MVGDIFIREATNAARDGVINFVSMVLAEFQLPFEPDSKDADLIDIERMYIQAGGIFEIIEDQGGRLPGKTVRHVRPVSIKRYHLRIAQHVFFTRNPWPRTRQRGFGAAVRASQLACCSCCQRTS